MAYYILYPRDWRKDVKILTKKPSPRVWTRKGYGFAEGPLRTKQDVRNRLGQMNRSVPPSF